MHTSRRVLVTGGSGGIGRAMVAGFIADGGIVAAPSRSGRVPAAAHGVGMELEDPASITAAIAEAERLLGGLDTLVVNAVRWPEGFADRFEAVEPTEWRTVLRANVEGAFSAVQAALPALRASAAGRIVLISSGAAEE